MYEYEYEYVTCGFRVPSMAYRMQSTETDTTQNGTFW